MQNTVTFNVCRDNKKAATMLAKRLVQLGHKAELLEVPETPGVDLSHKPHAVRHDAPSDVVVPLMVEVEEDHEPAERGERFRPSSSSPTGPFGDPPPDRNT